jgi:hypothetical protein
MIELKSERRESKDNQASLEENSAARPAANLAALPTARPVGVPYKLSGISGSRNQVFAQQLGEQLMRCLDLSPVHGKAEIEARSVAALSAMGEIGPRDGLEGMLAAQMAATQSAGLEFLARAVHSRQPQQGVRDGRLSAQLMTLFVRQIETLQRMRGRERRSVRIEQEKVGGNSRTSVSAEHEQVR